MSIPEPVRVLEGDLKTIFGGRLRSFLIYGVRERQAAPAHDAGQHHAAHASPTHTLAIVDTMTAADLRACAERAGGWHDRGLATPLLVAGHELETSLDAFPLEFGAIIADHQLVSGSDPFAGAAVDPADVRRACEVQARSHLLHLREGFIETRGNADALAVLIVRSAAPFAALLESLARLQGLVARDREGVGRHIERAIGMPGVVTDVITLAHVTEISAADASRLFPAYLEAVEKLVAWVDGWKAQS
jgi:hypothetical protein